MILEILIKLLGSVFLVMSMVIINYVIFKIPVRNNHKQIAIISLVVGATNFYFKFILESPTFMLIQILIYFVAIYILRQYPFFFALFVSGIGTIAIAFVDTIVTIGALRLNVSEEQMTNNLLVFSILHIVVSSILLTVAFVFYRLNIGFSFGKMRFTGKYAMNVKNFAWAMLVLVSTLIQQCSSQHIAIFSYHTLIFAIITLIFTVLTYYSYCENKKVIEENTRGN